MKLHRALSKAPKGFNGKPDLVDVAIRTGFDLSECHRLYAMTKAMLSTETPLTKNGKLKLADVLRVQRGPSQAFYEAHDRATRLIDESIAHLPPHEQDIVRDRYLDFSTSVVENSGATRQKALKALKRMPAIQRAHDIMHSFEDR